MAYGLNYNYHINSLSGNKFMTPDVAETVRNQSMLKI